MWFVWCGVCRQFVEACGHGLGINERLIKEDQQEYHDEMKANYRDLTRELSAIMHETVRYLKQQAPHTDPCAASGGFTQLFLFLLCLLIEMATEKNC